MKSKERPMSMSRQGSDAIPESARTPRWFKSSLSYANGDCVEVAALPDGRIGVRDSKDIAGPVLRFTPSEWAAFVGGVRNGEFDSPAI
jgi:hypothetical protein